MSPTNVRRLAAAVGIGLAGAVALWWLGAARIAVERGADVVRASADALLALCIARAVALPLVGIRVAAASGWRAGADAGLGLVTPAWPMVAVAWMAGTAPWVPTVAAELVLLAAAHGLPLLGTGLRRVVPPGPLDAAAAALAVALASIAWAGRSLWS